MEKLEKRNFWIYAIGRLVSLLGSGIQAVAIPLYILDLTGSGTIMGTFTMLSMLPFLIMSPFAGVLGDRWNRKKIMVNMDFARGFIVLLLALLAYNGNMTIGILFISQVVITIMGTIFMSSTGAMLPELVNEEDLLRANSIMGGIDSFSFIIGPVLGGVIYAFGIKFVFLLNGISFILSAISEMFIKYQAKKEPVNGKLSPKVFFEDMKEGLKFIKGDKSLLALLTYFALANFLINPAFSVVIPFALRNWIGFDDYQYGIIQATFTGGILIGNILITSVLAKGKSSRLLKIGLFGMLIVNLFLGLSMFPDAVRYFGGGSWGLLSVISTQLIIMGIFNALINTPLSTNFQKMIPNEIRSRVFSVTGVITQLGVPLGAVIYGVALDLIPVYFLYMIIAIVAAIVSIGFILKAPKEVFEPGGNPKPKLS